MDASKALQELEALIKQAKAIMGKYKKSLNAHRSTEKRKANGVKGGRKRVRDDYLIKSLRDRGVTIREIALKAGTSTTAVQRSLEEWDKLNPRTP